MLFRVHVIRIEIATMPVGRGIPAGFFVHRRRPAEIVVTALQGALGRQHRIAALIGAERAVGRAMHFRVRWIGKKPEWIFDAPPDRGRCLRRAAADAGQTRSNACIDNDCARNINRLHHCSSPNPVRDADNARHNRPRTWAIPSLQTRVSGATSPISWAAS